ncbi:MAG: tetratricopeptide repeat protein [Bacteroidia bacterium]
MKHIGFCLLFFVVHLHGTAQSKYIDSLRLLLKNAKHDTVRADIYLTWGEQIYLDQPDSAVILWQKVQQISEREAKKNPSNTRLHNSYLELLSSALNNIATVYENRGDIIKSLDYHHRSLKISEEVKDTAGIANSFNNMGVLYYYQNDLVRALEYFTKSLNIRERIGDKAGIAYCLNNLGEIYISQADQKSGKDEKVRLVKKALENYKKALKIREQINDKPGIAQSLNSIAGAYDGLGGDSALHKALEYYQKAVAVHTEAKNKGGTANSTYNVAAVYFDLGNKDKAIEYATRSLDLAKEVGYPADIRNAAKLLAICYKAKGDYKKAFENFELRIQMNDSIVNSETKKASIKSQLKYEYEKRAAADSVKNTEEQKVKDAQLVAQHAQIKQEKTQRYALLAGLLIVLVGLGFVTNRFRLTQRQKKIIELQKERMDRAYEELHEKNTEILDSIRYAQRIQRALLPNEKYIAKNLKK